MDVQIHEKILPEGAKEIRTEVFIEEQGFRDEFDETDGLATHFLLYIDGRAVATCRVFPGQSPNTYIFGRLAVRKKFRGQNLGSEILRTAESYVKKKGGRSLTLHAQCRASGFYSRLGYTQYGEIEEEEGCPHIWMKKEL